MLDTFTNAFNYFFNKENNTSASKNEELALPPKETQKTETGSKTMTQGISTVYDINGKSQALGAFVNRGGEGNVYRLQTNPNVLVKIYSDPQRANRQKKKIITMKNMMELRKNKHLAWPQLDIYDSTGQFIGFAMGAKEGFSLNQLGVPQLVAEKLPHWNRKHLVKATLSFVNCLQQLHSNNVLIGDVNPGNFLIDPQTCTVNFIDCDSYQIRTGKETFFCEVGMQQFMAPEFIGREMKTTIRTRKQDLFSAAMMIYRIFMFGAHPYSRVNGQDPVSNLKSGKCPLGNGSGCRFPRGSWYNYWSHLPYRMKSLFITMFRNGHLKPQVRPEVKDFRSALDAYYFGLDQGFHCMELMPDHPKSSNYNGNSQKIAS